MSHARNPVHSEGLATADEARASAALIDIIKAQVRQLEQQLAELIKQAWPPAQKP
jgi:hypothetical protein